MGIWALVVLGKPEVQAALQRNTETRDKLRSPTPSGHRDSAANDDIDSPPMKNSKWAVWSLILGIVALLLRLGQDLLDLGTE